LTSHEEILYRLLPGGFNAVLRPFPHLYHLASVADWLAILFPKGPKTRYGYMMLLPRGGGEGGYVSEAASLLALIHPVLDSDAVQLILYQVCSLGQIEHLAIVGPYLNGPLIVEVQTIHSPVKTATPQ
jgi:hypothetical protein